MPKPYPLTVQGQADAVADVVRTMAGGHDKRHRCLLHKGAWISAGGGSRAENSRKWEQYGPAGRQLTPPPTTRRTRVNTTAAAPWTIRRFFDSTGRALESLKVFSSGRETLLIKSNFNKTVKNLFLSAHKQVCFIAFRQLKSFLSSLSKT